MIFSDSPSQIALERMMTQVKGFPPRGSGVMVLILALKEQNTLADANMLAFMVDNGKKYCHNLIGNALW